MFEGITKFFKKIMKTEQSLEENSKDTAKERLHLVLMQDRANVSVDFLELMKQEIIDVIKKYIEVDEKAIDVRLTNQSQEDGTNGAPALYANIPIINIKNENKAERSEEIEINKLNETTNQMSGINEEVQKTETTSSYEEDMNQTEVVVRFADDEQENTNTDEIDKNIE